MSAWLRLAEEAARWHAAGKSVDFWWRDDDAQRRTASLDRLLALSARHVVPLTLAVIPEGADGDMLGEPVAGLTVIQHGVDHVNRAPAGQKKTEFPSGEPAAARQARLRAGREALANLFGDRFLPVLAPPWNRLEAGLVVELQAAGLRGLSQYGPRRSPAAAPQVAQVNTHVDIIAWQAGRNFAGDEAVLGAAVRHLQARRQGVADPAEPTGWLTHHAVHDGAAWAFLERLFEFSARLPAVRWCTAQELFHSE